MAIAGGTGRRKTVGLSRRSFWASTSTYKSDLVAGLPQRPSNATAYLCIFLGVCGLLLALFVGTSDPKAVGFTVLVAVVSLLFLLVGFGTRKPADQVADEQAAWENTWLCARCGHKWQG